MSDLPPPSAPPPPPCAGGPIAVPVAAPLVLYAGSRWETESGFRSDEVDRRVLCDVPADGTLSSYPGHLWMLWDDDRRTWHDKLVNGIVVKA